MLCQTNIYVPRSLSFLVHLRIIMKTATANKKHAAKVPKVEAMMNVLHSKTDPAACPNSINLQISRREIQILLASNLNHLEIMAAMWTCKGCHYKTST